MSILRLPPFRTWPSLILRRLGDALIAPPASFLPIAAHAADSYAADFYAAPVDRHQPTKLEARDVMGTWRPRIAVDTLRRDLARGIAPLAAVLAAAVMLAVVSVASGCIRLHAAWHAHEQRVAAAAQVRDTAASLINLIPPAGGLPMPLSAPAATHGGRWTTDDCASLNYPMSVGYHVPITAARQIAVCNLPSTAFLP